MKHVSPFFFILIFLSTSADQLPKERDEQISELQKQGYNLIDTIFANAHIAVEGRKDLMNAQWLSEQKEIKDLRNLLSDATIIFEFDGKDKNPIPEMLSQYVLNKTNEEIPHVFETEGISVKRVKDFYEFSHTICTLSGGLHCGRMVRKMESDHFDRMLRLRLQKIAREQWRKESAEQLRTQLIFGGSR
jgi:hypothetical protein